MWVLALASAAFATPTLTITGSCPGPVDIEVTGATPGGHIAFLSADGPGNAPIPQGPCTGNTGLDASGLTFRKLRTADGTGATVVQPNLGASMCGLWVQAVDADTCTTSAAVPLSSAPDCTFVPDPANAVGESGYLTGTTAAHNAWRDRVGVPPLVWNNALAQSAQAYADTCPGGHDANRSPDAGFTNVGENIYWAWPSADGPQAVDSWASERVDYDYGTLIDFNNYLVFGHYTQAVWSTTTDLGCGYADCQPTGGYVTIICRYGESGNWIGNAPYDWTDDACMDLDNDDVFQWEDADDTDRSVQ